MFRTPVAPLVSRIPLALVTGLVISLLTLDSLRAQAPTPSSPQERESATQKQASPNARVFASDAGMVLNFIEPDKTTSFEAILGRLREALHKSDKPGRKQQAQGWKVFRAVEPAANGNVLYLFVMDPVVQGQDYAISTILAEALPTEVQELYRDYADAYASGQNVVNPALGQ